MATLYIAEYAATAGDIPIALAAPIAEQTVAIGGSSTQSAAFDPATVFVRVHSDAICSIAFGANPTATAAKQRLSADQTEYFGIKPSSATKIAVITNT